MPVELEDLRRELQRRVGDAAITVDPPDVIGGSWFIDVERDDRTASVEWRSGNGFGVSAPGGAYGERPDLMLTTAEAAAEYVRLVLDLKTDAGTVELQEQADLALQFVSGLHTRQLQEQVGAALRSLSESQTQLLQQHFEAMLRSMHAAHESMEQVMRTIGVAHGIQLPPPLRHELTFANEEVRRAELQLRDISDLLLGRRSDSSSSTAETPN